MRVLWFLAVLISYAAAENGEVSQMIGNTSVSLRWTTDYTSQSVLFSVSLSNDDLEWVGIGFSDHGTFNHSDLCFFRNGKLTDLYIDDKFFLHKDLVQDCELLKAAPGKFEFRRRFTTCDIRDYAIENGTTQFIISGSSEFTGHNFSSSDVQKYLRYGQIVDAPVPTPRVKEEVSEVTILAKAAEITAEVTTYWCVVKKLPIDLLQRKHHLVKVQAVVEPGHEHLVHHMIIFVCQTDDQEDFSGNCQSPKKPKQSKSCSHVMAAWAMGEGPVYYPEEAGFPLGGENSRQYVMVEIHYNNAAKESGIIDNSGLKLVVTPNMRKYDAGILEVGTINSDAYSIPPGVDVFPITGYCVSDCTENLLEDGIYVFASQLHAHLTGRKLWTSQYRDDNHYSPHWQHVQQVRPYVHVKKGDLLSTTCVYETRNKNKITLGGYGIEDEMCGNYLYYYPASPVEVCKSSISNDTLHSYFKQRYGLDTNLPIHKKYNTVDWNNEETRALHELYSTAPLNMHCQRHDGSLFPGKNWSAVPQPRNVAGKFANTRSRHECPALND